MSKLRWIMVIATGTISGLLWGVLLVDFEPEWFRTISPYPKIWLLAMPVIIALLFSAAFSWWDWKAHVVYLVVVLAWWISGAVRNELVNTEGPLWVFSQTFVSMSISGAIALSIAWSIGRLVNQRGERG